MSERATRKMQIEARRARVAELLLHRMTYKDIGALIGCTDATVAGDVKWLRKQWAKTYEDLGAMYERSAMDQDLLQHRIVSLLDQLPPDEQTGLIGRLITLMDQRNRLHNLYKGQETPDIPTGPIQIDIKLIEPGNRQLIADEDEDDETGIAEDLEPDV